MLKKINWIHIVIFTLAALIFSLISFPNHYYFRTENLDYGMLNHALANFSEFKTNTFTCTPYDRDNHFLADHFSPIMYVYIPFFYIFQDYALLVVQIVTILIGGWGVLKLSSLYFSKKGIQSIILFHFFTLWGIVSALAVGFHNNVVGAMLIPLLIYYYKKEKFLNVVLLSLLVLITKENMALLLSPILVSFIFWNKSRSWLQKMKFEIPLFIFSVLYFFVTLQLIMPWFNNGVKLGQMDHFKYLGDSFFDIIKEVISNPMEIIKLLYSNNSKMPQAEDMKFEFYQVLIFSGGLFLLRHPKFIIMIIPLLAQKFIIPKFELWGINGHYSIEFLPIISYAIIESLVLFKKYSVQLTIGSILIISSLYINQNKLQFRHSKWYDSINYDIQNPRHFNSDFNVDEIYDALKLIPDHKIVTTSSALGSHLPNRKLLYHFPIIDDAEYIVLLKGNNYPLNLQEYTQKIDELLISKEFETIYNNKEIYVFKKR